MWPFGAKSRNPRPEDVAAGGMTARYDAKLKHWVFQCDRIEFNVSGIPFNQAAFEWAKEGATTIRSLETAIRGRVVECLGNSGNPAKAEILSVDLDEYTNSKTMNVAVVGDESWGDFGVNVVIA